MSIGDLVSWAWFDENKRIGIIVDKVRSLGVSTKYVVMWGNGQTDKLLGRDLIPFTPVK